MKFNIEKRNLIDALKFSNSVCSLNATTSPILSALLINVTKERIIITASNNYISSNYEITGDKYECVEEGVFLVRSKLLLDTISKLSNEMITISKLEENMLVIKCGNFESQLILLEPEQYPEINFDIEDDENTKILNFPTEQLLEIESKLQNLVSTVEGGNVFKTYCFQIKDGVFRILSSDMFRLGVLEYPTENENIEMNIEPSTLKLLTSIFKADETVLMKVNGIRARIDYNNITLITRLNEGKYPNPESLLNTENTFKIRLEKKKFQDAIDRCIVVDASKRTPCITFTVINEKQIECYTSSVEIGTVQEQIDIIETESTNFKFALNSTMLSSLLKNFEGTELSIKAFNESPVVIFKDEDQENFTQVLAAVKAIN